MQKKIGDSYIDERVKALNMIESTVPAELRAILAKAIRSNTEATKSKFTRKENDRITMDTLVAFNYDLQMALQQYEMADHLYESNMIKAHYFLNIQKSIVESDRMYDNDFTHFHDKEMLFRYRPGFGRVGS